MYIPVEVVELARDDGELKGSWGTELQEKNIGKLGGLFKGNNILLGSRYLQQ